MAATARSDLLDGLVRKIGYSVGLEYLLSHVKDVAQLFAAERSLDGTSWRHLVHDVWKRPLAEQHFADVYSQLDLLRRHNRSVHPLPSLEVLSILYSTPPTGLEPARSDDESDSETQATRFILTLRILEADGDIFLNALAAGFQPAALGFRLQRMIRHKRRALSPFFQQAAALRRVMEAVSIRSQAERPENPRHQSYAERSRALMTTTPSMHSTAQREHWADDNIFISADYLQKACVTRGSWADDLGLFHRRDGVITHAGEELLRRTRDLGLSIESENELTFAFWPYTHELSRMSLSATQLGVPDLHGGALTRLVAELLAPSQVGHSDLRSAQEQRLIDRQEFIRLLEFIQARYQASSRRGAIRHDLPIFVAEPVLAYWYTHAGLSLPDLRAFLRTETQRKDRLVDFVMIHGTEGGLRLMNSGASIVSRH